MCENFGEMKKNLAKFAFIPFLSCVQNQTYVVAGPQSLCPPPHFRPPSHFHLPWAHVLTVVMYDVVVL